MYMHLNILMEEGFIIGKKKGRWNDYTITKKGMVTVEKIKEIDGNETRVPKIRMRVLVVSWVSV